MKQMLILAAVLGMAATAVGDERIVRDCEDGVVDDRDLSLLLAHWGQDVTGEPYGGWCKGEFDGVAPVNDADLSLLLSNWTASRAPGTALAPGAVSPANSETACPGIWKLMENWDGVIDDRDLSLLLAHWGQDVTGDPDGGVSKRELTGTPPIDDADLSCLLSNWTARGDPTIPEPATLGLLFAGAAVLIRRRR